MDSNRKKESRNCNCEAKLVNGVFKNLGSKKIQCIKLSDAKPGNFVPVVNDHIDLASSTNVNNPIIPLIKPPDHELKNKKYQVIIDFKEDIQGKIWPEWMREPTLHALGMTNVSSEVKKYVDKNVMPVVQTISTDIMNHIDKDVVPKIENIDNRLSNVEISASQYLRIATLSSIGLVKGSDLSNQISVLNDGRMEVNSLAFSKISQDIDIVLYDPTIEEDPDYGRFLD